MSFIAFPKYAMLNILVTLFSDLVLIFGDGIGYIQSSDFQAAMSKVEDAAKKDDLFYDQFSEQDELWFDFMADTGDGGNSSYSVARLLAQPAIRIRGNDSVVTLPRGNLLLIGGDLA